LTKTTLHPFGKKKKERLRLELFGASPHFTLALLVMKMTSIHDL
jgi:hypothetical protein